VLATHLATNKSLTPEGLVLLAPAYRPASSTFKWSYVAKSILGRAFLGKGFQVELPYTLQDVTRNQSVLQEPQHCVDFNFTLTANFLLEVRDLCNQAFQKVTTLSVPTLMIVPGEDKVCDISAMEQAFGRIPKITPKTFQAYPERYHDVLLDERSELVANDVLLWANGLLKIQAPFTATPSVVYAAP
jgi:alpha-beta hydrolase superfamily lysophospholipase